MSPLLQTEQETHSTLAPVIPRGAKILIVCDDDAETERLKGLLFKAGFVPDRVRSLRAGCEAALSGRYQVIVSTPELRDGSWRRLVEVADRYGLHFEIILWARHFDLCDWGEALNDGAFDVLDAVCEDQRAIEATKSAIWSAYLKGAGPKARAVVPCKVA